MVKKSILFLPFWCFILVLLTTQSWPYCLFLFGGRYFGEILQRFINHFGISLSHYSPHKTTER